MEYFQFLIIILFSPLVNGVIKKVKANMQGRRGPGVLQPYYDLARLFKKDMVVSSVTSWIFKAAPYIVFVSTMAAAMIVPVVSMQLPYAAMGDVIALIYLFALARFFMALAGLDAGTAFGGEGSSREMTIAILVEPMMMLALFTAAISAGSTNIAVIAGQQGAIYSPSHLLALAAFTVAIIAETGRVPVDNPDTHLELTMIHEGMILEYSGRYLALMEWAHYMKQMILFTLAVDIFFPAGIAEGSSPAVLILPLGIYAVKMLGMAVIMAAVESTRAKVRFFQLPSILGGAFVLACLSLVTHIMMGK
ncbi:MAG TPA: respiratory chain complex I subunit 1 family protein [Nitrospirota bacterium]|nr:respiratory chain complex I subunit 1 family protein [Nitrospirota bacterium]